MEVFDTEMKNMLLKECRNLLIFFGYVYDPELSPDGYFKINDLTQEERKQINYFKTHNQKVIENRVKKSKDSNLWDERYEFPSNKPYLEAMKDTPNLMAQIIEIYKKTKIQ